MTHRMTMGLAAIAVALAGQPTFAQAQAEPVERAYARHDPVPLRDSTPDDWHDWPGNLGIAEESSMPGPAGAIYNVSDPTYTAYLPDAARNTGTAVIVAPGGGFRLLAMEHEGHQVASWLAERGVAAFVLKYRLAQMATPQDFGASMQALPMEVAGAPAVADGLRALELVRDRADDYRIDPSRVVMVGFSAGAHVVAHAALATDPAARPDYAAPIYGAPFDRLPDMPPADGAAPLPPMFIAMAQDDELVGDAVRGFIGALDDAGYRPEVHLYRNGGHGFGMTPQGATSDRWIDQFFWWLTTHGLTRRPGEPAHTVNPMPGPDFSASD